MPTYTVSDMMTAYAEDAVDHMRHVTGETLDYSVESVELVEALLDDASTSVPKGLFSRLFRRGLAPKNATRLAKFYGAYIGEVLRRSEGGEWIDDTQTMPGHRVVALEGPSGCRTWPVMKVGKRLHNGEEDNVYFYLQALQDYWHTPPEGLVE